MVVGVLVLVFVVGGPRQPGQQADSEPPSQTRGLSPLPHVERLWRAVETGTEVEAQRAGGELVRVAQGNRGARLDAPGMSLVSRLENPNPRVRSVAIRIIREAELEYFIPHLVCRLSDVNWRVRHAALVTLDELTGQTFGSFDKNSPMEAREQSILGWWDYWIGRDPGDGEAELLALYASGAHLELGSALSHRVFGAGGVPLPEPAGLEADYARRSGGFVAPRRREEYPLALEVSVVEPDEGGRVLTLAVAPRQAGSLGVEPGAVLVKVRFLDGEGALVQEVALPYEVPGPTSSEASRRSALPLPAGAATMEYEILSDAPGAPEGSLRVRLGAGRVRFEDVSFLPLDAARGGEPVKPQVGR